MRLLLLILSTSLLYSNLHGQVYDSIDFKKISINGLVLGSTKTELVKKFGEPQKTVTTEGTKGTDIYSDYHYHKSTLRVSPALLFNGFKLTDKGMVLRYGQHTVKIGDPIEQFAGAFLQSAKSYRQDAGKKMKLKIKASNSYVVLKTKDGTVSEIEIREEIQ
jgi:hypothetical protein